MSFTALPANLLSKISITKLSEKCRDAKKDRANEPYCFELFRRAILDNDHSAWGAVYAQYNRLVYGWVVKAVGSSSGINIYATEDFVIDTFSKFWNAFNAEQLDLAENSLSHILAYLKRCAITRVGEARRRQVKRALDTQWENVSYINHQSENTDTVYQVLEKIGEEAIWEEIEQACTDELDMIVARLGIACDLKPKRILDLHPNSFSNAREIYDRRRNLRDRLKRSSRLQNLLGID